MENMKISEYKCDLCKINVFQHVSGEDYTESCVSMPGIGLESSGCGGYYERPIEDTKKHLCLDCLKAIKNFTYEK